MDTKESVKEVLRLDDNWPYKVIVLANKITRRTMEALSEVSSLNLSQWRVLAAVADQPGRTSKQVAAITPMDKVLVSRAVRTLSSNGYVRREASQTDGRLAHLHLTTLGWEQYNKIVLHLRTTSTTGVGVFSVQEEKAVLNYLQRAIEKYSEKP